MRFSAPGSLSVVIVIIIVVQGKDKEEQEKIQTFYYPVWHCGTACANKTEYCAIVKTHHHHVGLY